MLLAWADETIMKQYSWVNNLQIEIQEQIFHILKNIQAEWFFYSSITEKARLICDIFSTLYII